MTDTAAANSGSGAGNGVRPSVLIPIAPGTNRNDEMAQAFELAGARAHQYPLEAIRRGETRLSDYQILALPGGFSYGDALGAGRVLGLELNGWFRDQLEEARAREMPIIGVCNGFQALVYAGLLPGGDTRGALIENAGGRFECRWVYLQPGAAHSIWTAELEDPIWCPVAHGEGRYVSDNGQALADDDLVAFRYCRSDGSPADGQYPLNPNGSAGDVAGICDPSGLVLGMMPHPEDHVMERQSPHRRRPNGARCLALFTAGVKALAA